MIQHPARELLYMLQKDTRSFLLAILVEFMLTNTEIKPNNPTRKKHLEKKKTRTETEDVLEECGGCSFEFLEILFIKS